MPAAAAFASLAAGLVGRSVKATAAKSLPHTGVRGVATYVDEAGTVRFLAVADISFMAGMGAALAMIPPGIVADAVAAGKLSEALTENAYEVLNVAASLFNALEGATFHVKLERVNVGPLGADLLKSFAKPLARLDMNVEMAGYPKSTIILAAVA